MTEAARLEAERAKMQALEMEYRGDIESAKNILRSTSGLLKQAVPQSVAAPLVANLDFMESGIDEGLTEAERKEAHYATYRTQRSRKDYKK